MTKFCTYRPDGTVDLVFYQKPTTPETYPIPDHVFADWKMTGPDTWEAPPAPPPPVPAIVTAAQARIALRRAGYREAVEAMVAAAGDGELADWYEYATHWERANAYVAQLGAALGLSEEAIDTLFQEAAAI